MEKRVKLLCWNSECNQEYSLLRDVGQAKLLVECPFCGSEAEVDLAPWRDSTVTIMRSGESHAQAQAEILNLPDVLPTSPIKHEPS